MATQTQTQRAAMIEEYPITMKHAPPVGLERVIPNPGQPVANRAISKEKPEGTPTSPPNATALQQHVLWFDRDGDGVIWPSDTFWGFHKLGFGYLFSTAAAIVIHGTFSLPTQGWILNPFLPINLEKMHRTKHGSDSEVYDVEGRFVPQKFEEIFSKYDRDNKGGLSWNDIQEMVYSNMNVNDPNGWVAERLEWWTFYWLAKDEKGIVSKEKVRAQYDGSLWEIIAADVEKKRKGGRVSPEVQRQAAKIDKVK